MDEAELRLRVAASPVARLATVRPDGRPHLVPIVFALSGNIVYTAVDAKPKRTLALQRLANVRHRPRCSLLVDHYDDDWTRLWWVRVDGAAVVVDDPPPEHEGLLALVARHPQYGQAPPKGPLLVVTVDRWSGWSATSG